MGVSRVTLGVAYQSFPDRRRHRGGIAVRAEPDDRRSPDFSGWLHYHGWVPVTELSRRLPEFHVGINPVRDYPNYRHSLLTKLFDYAAAGLPVITTDLPGIMREFGEAGFLASYSSGDVAGLAAAIRAFFNEERRVSMAQKALDAGQRYSWDSQAQVLLEIYREILA